jgi:hypothetical protein
MEPIEGVVNAIRAGSERAERISQTLLTPEPQSTEKKTNTLLRSRTPNARYCVC